MNSGYFHYFKNHIKRSKYTRGLVSSEVEFGLIGYAHILELGYTWVYNEQVFKYSTRPVLDLVRVWSLIYCIAG